MLRRQRARWKATYRRRLALGQVVYRVTASECGLVEALLRAGRLDEARALDRSEIEHELAEIIGDFIKRWGDVHA